MNTLLLIAAIFLVMTFCWKYRWEIFGAYVDLIEPHEKEVLKTVYVTEQAETDYDNIQLFVSRCSTVQDYQAAIDQIYNYQQSYYGDIHEQRVDDALKALEARYTGTHSLLN